MASTVGNRPDANLAPSNTTAAEEANTGAHVNPGVDDGLLDDGGPAVNHTPSSKPEPPPPSADDDNEIPEAGARPRYPSPRPTTPWTPIEPVHPDSPTFFNRGINYSTKKTIAQGMMDIALLTANASQLRYVMRSPYWDVYHQANMVLISISIALQIIVGMILIFIGAHDYRRKEGRPWAQHMNDVVVMLIFIITIVNIFIASFGVDDERTTYLRWKAEHNVEAVPTPFEPFIAPIRHANHSGT